jgi:hypothetical protein
MYLYSKTTMLHYWLLLGSKDNISVVVVRLPGARVGPSSDAVAGLRRLREERIRVAERSEGTNPDM